MEPDSYDWQAEILERMAGHPEAAERIDLAWVLGEPAVCYAHLGRHNDAASTLHRAMEIGPKPPFFRRLLIAEGFLRTGRADDAETLYSAMKGFKRWRKQTILEAWYRGWLA
ncbi:MAG TPA: hypothetical protein VD969_27730 [Symbiobacteriaceae bacterium]|nr:hypothetical protein [Symbiobacteriaceae bacterium]